MNQSNFHNTLGGFVILLAIVACVLPSQPTPLAPETNPNLIETAVVGTAQAAAQQTEQASLVTSTPISIPTETLVATPKISSAGTSLLTLADGSTQFSDHVAGVQMVFPPGWLVVRLGEEEYYAAWEKKEIHSPEFLNVYSRIQDQDPKLFRVHALDTRPGYTLNGIITNISVVFQAGDTQPLEEWEKAFRDQPLPYKGFKFISSSYPQTNNGIRVLVTEASWLNTDGGTNYYRYVFFSLPSGTVHLDFETSFDYKDVMLPELDHVVNSVKLLGP